MYFINYDSLKKKNLHANFAPRSILQHMIFVGSLSCQADKTKCLIFFQQIWLRRYKKNYRLCVVVSLNSSDLILLFVSFL
jgi:hypothetical protein